MQMRFIDPLSTTVEEIHEFICDTAVELANGQIAADTRIPKKFKGSVFQNGAPYNEGRLTLDISEEFWSATDRVKDIYREIAVRAIQSAILQHNNLFVGLILGEAKAGRNYFNSWEQAPTVLF